MNRASWAKLAMLAVASVLTFTAPALADPAPPCSCVTSIDGHVFVGMPYYAPSSEVDSAVEYWWELSARPDYRSLPPVLSVSVITEITGTVDPPSDPPAVDRSSWG